MRQSPKEEAASRRSQLSLHRECTDITYRIRTRAVYSHFAVAAVPLAVGWGRPWNLALVGLLLAYAFVGIVTNHWYNARPSSDESATLWARWLQVQLVGLGLIYNLVFMNLDHQGVPHAMDYLMLLTALFCAGGAASYQYLRGLAIVFIVSAVSPQVIFHLVSGHEGDGAIAFLLTVFMVFMSTTSMDLHRDAMGRLELTRQLSVAKNDAERLARTDGLTGLLNRRAFFEVGQTLLAGARRDDRPFAVVMMDIDHFKDVNDDHGHAMGDTALVAIADVIRATKRESDVAGRVGGEEFAVVLPNTDPSEARKFAERLRHAIRSHTIEEGDVVLKLTASLGVTDFTPDDLALDAVIQRADAALYRAKADGRDCTVMAVRSKSDPGPEPIRSALA